MLPIAIKLLRMPWRPALVSLFESYAYLFVPSTFLNVTLLYISFVNTVNYVQNYFQTYNWSMKLHKSWYICSLPFAKAGNIKTHLSVRLSVPLSVCHKKFNLAHIFWSVNDRALIFGMHDPCDRSCQLTPCCYLDLWPTSRSNLLLSGGPPFYEFACIVK